MFARGIDDNAEADDQDGIGGEALIEQKLPRGQRKNQEPGGGEREKEIATSTQAAGDRAEAGPHKDGAFDSKGQGDPFAVEANGNGQGSKGQREAREEQSR